MLNKRQRISKGKSKIDNPEKLATYGTQDEEKQNTICVGHHYMQTNTNKGNAKRGVSPRLKIDPVTLTFDLENQ